MNIESTSATITKTAEISNSTASSNSTTSIDSTTSFKEELHSAKVQDSNNIEEGQIISAEISHQSQSIANQKAQELTGIQGEAADKITQQATQAAAAEDTQKPQNIVNYQNTQVLQNVQERAVTNAVQQIAKDKNVNDKDKISKKIDRTKISDPAEELSSKIATLSQLKNMTNSQVGHSTSEKISSKDDYGKTIKMDSKDITFFLNLVDNQQMVAQSAQANNQLNNPNLSDNSFTQIKTEAAQATVNVSQTLLDSLNDAAKTGKAFRIDFDNNIAVIMKVDKEGVLSANFIPGTAAVEAYLKNNISGLRQAFDEQGLPYNQLSYSNQQKQQKQKQQKENEDE